MLSPGSVRFVLFSLVITFITFSPLIPLAAGSSVNNGLGHGQFTLDGKQYQIPANSGPNAMHGGTKGFNQEVWGRLSD